MMKDPYSIIKHPVATEKAVKIMETENKLTFIVEKKATRTEIKKAIETAFTVKVLKVNTVVTPKGIKKAYARLSPANPAIDVATQLGMI